MRKILLAGAFILSTGTSFAADTASNYLSFSAGQFDSFSADNQSGAFGAEFRFKPVAWGVVRPIIGGLFNADNALYGYAGFDVDYNFAGNLYITPSIAAGAYDEGDSKDLGGALEFRSSLELAYEFDSRSRLGLAFSHISNAGIYDDNPGTETIMLTYSMPVPGN
jgi:lipid A 3-O-deacylase